VNKAYNGTLGDKTVTLLSHREPMSEGLRADACLDLYATLDMARRGEEILPSIEAYVEGLIQVIREVWAGF